MPHGAMCSRRCWKLLFLNKRIYALSEHVFHIVSVSFGRDSWFHFSQKKEKIPCQMIQIASVLDKKCDTPVHWLILNKLIYALLEHMFHIVSVSFGSDSWFHFLQKKRSPAKWYNLQVFWTKNRLKHFILLLLLEGESLKMVFLVSIYSLLTHTTFQNSKPSYFS